MKKQFFYNALSKLIILIIFLCIFVPAQALYSINHTNTKTNISYPIIMKSENTQQSTLYADGKIINLPIQSVYQLIDSSDIDFVTVDSFQTMVTNSENHFQNDQNKYFIDQESSSSLDFTFIVSSPPEGALDALADIETYLENIFYDNIDLTIEIGFSSLSPGILGWTQSFYAGPLTWTDTRNGLINGMDGDDYIQEWLPAGSTIPVRYDYYDSSVTNENKCFFTKANYKATIGTVSGIVSHTEINTDYYWDYDPSNGVSYNKMCFQSVVIHEIGHALGFTSGADFRYNDIETLDIFRFQRLDGSQDYNPDTYEEFQTTPRLVDLDDGSAYDDVNSDLIAYEYRMSDGYPYQCSHFHQGVYAIMQPAIGAGDTFYPNFYKPPDLNMLDAIGWDNVEIPYYELTVTTDGEGIVSIDPLFPSYPEGTEVHLLAEGDEYWCFSQWTGDLESTNPNETIIMDSDKSITAHFYELCPCDVNRDGVVDPADVGLVKAAYGQDPNSPLYSRMDVNNDGVINPADVGLVKAAYGQCPVCG